MTRVATALSIAGSDSGGGAGVQADLKTFAALGVFGTTAITAITAQNTRGVIDVEVVSTRLVIAQIEAVVGDIDIHATKIGMLATADIVEAVADAVARLALPHVVLDPVMVAKSGDALLAPAAVATLKRALLPLASVVTPNLPEAEVLVGRPVKSLADMKRAAQDIVDMGPRAVVIKGGHGVGAELVDLFFDGRQMVEFATPRIETRHTHGTGCTFSAAIAAFFARGEMPVDSVRQAQHYVAGAIRHARAIGHGHGPLHHGWLQRGDVTPTS